MQLEINLSKINILNKIEILKSEIEKLRPVDAEKEQRIMQKFRLDWNYHSNAIEGNSLNYGETYTFLMHGITAKGKPLKDYLDIKGHNAAINFLTDLVKNIEELTEKDIRAIHEIILCEPYEVDAITPDGIPTKKRISLGRYKTSPNHVKTSTGEIHHYASPEETPIKMQELMTWYREAKINTEIHPLVLAGIFHHKFVEIHPFDDGNGRMARLLMNLILMQNHFPPAIIKSEDRNDYYLALSMADTGDMEPLINYMGETLIHSMEIYIKGARGENIDEPDDLDKEIILFKKELEGRKDKLEKKRSIENQIELYENSLEPLIINIENTINKFRDLFLTYSTGRLDLMTAKSFLYWRYEFFDMDKKLKPIFTNSTSFQRINLVFQLNEFKLENNPFGLELKIYFYFNEYKYDIYFTVSEYMEFNGLLLDEYDIYLNEPLVSNYYHQFISKEDIKNIADKIGKSVLNFIKDQNNDPTSHLFKLENSELTKIWEEYAETISDTEEKTIWNKYSQKYLESDGKFISIVVIDDKDENCLKRHRKDFIEFLREKLNITRNIGFKIRPIPKIGPIHF